MNKKVIILRGLPGSGKSTLANKLADENNGIIFSTDNYFMHNGKYNFDVSKLGAAHTWNRQKYQQALENGEKYVIVDNTNTTKKEIKPYLDIALSLGYNVEIMEPENPDKFNVDICFQRNTHGVPKEQIQRMKDRWQNLYE